MNKPMSAFGGQDESVGETSSHAPRNMPKDRIVPTSGYVASESPRKTTSSLTLYDKVATALVLISISLAILVAAITAGNISSQWDNITTGIEATLIDNSRPSIDNGQIATVTYFYEGEERTGVASAPSTLLPGDTVEIAVQTDSGDILLDLPNAWIGVFAGLAVLAVCGAVTMIILWSMGL